MIEHSYLWYDPGRRIRLSDAACQWRRDSRLATLDLGACAIEATYLDQLATNIDTDVPIVARGGQTFRELDRSPDGGLKPFDECIQANAIGVAALFVDRHGAPIQRWRGKVQNPHDPTEERLALMKCGWHCGSSGALTWEDIVAGEDPNATPAARQKYWLDGLVRGMAR